MENINKLDEFEIWNNIFISDSKEEIEHLIKLVVMDESARELVCDNICEMKNIPLKERKLRIKISLNEDFVDKENIGELAKQISNEIVDAINTK